MPLVAQVNEVRTVSTLLTDAEWTALQREARAKQALVLLPCGRPGHLRTSKLGTRHFAHNPNREPCTTHPKETAEHLLVKALIVKAATAAGWDAEPEVRGDGWVADVIAWRNGVRVAFEVQWSRQTADEYEDRQARYARDGIRCAWFARHAGPTSPPDRDLPVFRLSIGQDGARVHVGDYRLTVEKATQALLSGRVRYREHVGTPTITLNFHDVTCERCREESAVWQVVPRFVEGACGMKLPKPSVTQRQSRPFPETLLDIREAVTRAGVAHSLSLARVDSDRCVVASHTRPSVAEGARDP